MRPLLRRYLVLGLGGCALLLVVACGIWMARPAQWSEAATIGKDVASFVQLQRRFQDLARTKTALYAFEVLRRADLPPNTDLHLLGHVVGDELYKQQGTEGVQYCTQEFRNACSHSIVVGALTDFGEGALPAIHDACTKAPGGPGAYTMCYHGLGHGVFAYFKYDFPSTVALCKKTGTAEFDYHEYSQCVGGAVMELMGGGSHDPANWESARKKYLTAAHPLAPCTLDFMPENSKNMCLMYLTPRLWEEVGIDLAEPDPELFGKAFALCNTLPKSQKALRDSCFGGFGKEFVPLMAARDIRSVTALSEDAMRTIIEWCAAAGARDGRESCISQARASLFWGGENDPSAALTFCSLTTGTDQTSCYGNFAPDVATYVRSPQERDRICAAFPHDMQDVCQRASAATP